MQEQKRLLIRALIGGAAGGSPGYPVPQSTVLPRLLRPGPVPAADRPGGGRGGRGHHLPALLCSGGGGGAGTLPFADEGPGTGGPVPGPLRPHRWDLRPALGLCFGVRQWPSMAAGPGIAGFVLCFGLAGRWVGWYAEADAIRKSWAWPQPTPCSTGGRFCLTCPLPWCCAGPFPE